MNKFRLLAVTLMLSTAALINGASPTRGSATGPQANQGATSTVATANYTTPISPSQVNNSGRYVIKTAGYYFLTEDLHYYPKNFATNATNDDATLGASGERAAIYIEADNVVLDLNNKSISMNNNTKTTSVDYINAEGVDAIIVKGGMQNVVVKNGTISYSTGYGIHVVNGATDGATNGITISNMNIMNCPLGGILVGSTALDGSGTLSFGISINNVAVSKCQGTIAYGSQGSYAYTGDGNARGIILNQVTQGQISNVSCSNNHINEDSTVTQSIATSDATGLYIVDSQNVEVANSSFNRNNAYKSYGMHIETSNNVHVMDCKCLNNFLCPISVGTAVAATADAESFGIRVNGSHFCRFDNCEASENHVSDTALVKYGAGFFLDGRTAVSSNNTFNNCLASGNAGGPVAETSTVTDEDSVVVYDITGGGIGAGFLDMGTDATNLNTGNQFLNCTAKGNTCGTATGTAGGSNALGIGLIYSDSATVEGCVCLANGAMAQSDIRGVGLLLGPIGLNSETGSSKTAAYTRNAVVRNNWFISNTWHGLYDMAADSQSLFMENYAFRNGIENAVYAEGNIGFNQLNFKVDYEQSNENLPLTSGTVGGFGAFNVAGRYVNTEIQVTADSLTPGDTGFPFVPAED